MFSLGESITPESYTATVGFGIPRIVWTRVQSRPSNNAANSTGVSFIAPSMIGGQRNDPCCNCFQISTIAQRSPGGKPREARPTAGIPNQDLDAVRAFAAVHNDGSRERIRSQYLLCQRSESVCPFAKIHWPRRQ